MHIDDNHMYHGAALIQVAEDKHFTAINSLTLRSKRLDDAYRINDEIALWLKYASRPTPRYKEYVFTFNRTQMRQLSEINEVRRGRTFIALLCVRDREICCISYMELDRLVQQRKQAKQAVEVQYTILVTMPPGKSFRVYVNAPGKKKTIQGKMIIVARNKFPGGIFGS